jgi:TolB-like protein/Flp pilus assembly protein TadD
MNPANFFAELKRRNVYKVAVAYAVVGWLLIQIATQVFPFFEIPNWAVRLIVLGIVIGFPIALVIAWAFELTPEGIKRTEDVDAAAQSRTKSHAWIYVVIGGALLSFGLFMLGRYGFRESSSTSKGPSPKSIAVLPFENLSDDKSAAYFADGVQDEILTKLASVADLKVISRISTAKYKSKPEDLKTVSQQLDVANVLEGTVQKAGDKVRVNVQLIDARADSHLWAKSYDRDLKDVFAVESEVAQEIADSLRAKLSPREANTIATAPTLDPAAYDLFLKGEHERTQGEIALTAEWFDRADEYYRQALSRDPGFALAVARLAESRLYRHWFIDPLNASELEDVKASINRALALSPAVAELHFALGVFYYWGHRQYEPALAEFRRAIELQPNSLNARQFSAAVHYRQGQWEQARIETERAEELDPRDANLPGNFANTYVALRQWDDAQRAGLRALALDPKTILGMRAISFSRINGYGDLEGAKRAYAGLAPGVRLTANAVGGIAAVFIDERTYVHVLERDFPGALKDWNNETGGANEHIRRLCARTAIHVLAGDAATTKAESEEARAILEATLRERPDDPVVTTRLSWVYLALGRKTEAVAMAKRSVELMPIERDAVSGPSYTAGLAQIYAQAGEAQEAVKLLRHLLSIPAGTTVSIQRLKLDPAWDPIRNDPQFQQLLTMKEHVGP